MEQMPKKKGVYNKERYEQTKEEILKYRREKYRTIRKKDLSYLNSSIVFPSHQVGSLIHHIGYIHFCFPIITYIIILYKQKKNQSKNKVKVPVLTEIFGDAA